MALYEVVIDGKVVWSAESDDVGLAAFPDEYRGRPESGEVALVCDGEIIAVQRPIDPADLAAFAPRVNVVGSAG